MPFAHFARFVCSFNYPPLWFASWHPYVGLYVSCVLLKMLHQTSMHLASESLHCMPLHPGRSGGGGAHGDGGNSGANAAMASQLAAEKDKCDALLTQLTEAKARITSLEAQLVTSQSRERELNTALLHSRTVSLQDGMNAAQRLLMQTALMLRTPAGQGGPSSADITPISFDVLTTPAPVQR